MRTLLEETEELLSRARHLEGKQANAMPSDCWTRLISVCDQARQVCPELLVCCPGNTFT